MKRGKTAFFAPFHINFPFLFILIIRPFPKNVKNTATPAILVDYQLLMGGRTSFSLHLPVTP